MGEERLFVGVTKAGENQGKSMRINKSMPIQIIENQDIQTGVKDKMYENSELLVTDPKRRRIDQPNSSRPKNGSD